MKKVIITGGQGDIAKEIYKALIATNLYSVYSPGKDEMDVTNIESVNTYIAQHIPDILINNAGYVHPVAISENDMDTEQKSISVNLLGVFNCTGATLIRNKNAIIINIGSSAGTKVHSTWSSYCATKAGVIMATKCWAEEGVRTVCVSPGRTATKMRKRLFPVEDMDSLLEASQFAKIVIKAIDGEYQNGSNIDVSINNIKELLK